MALTTENTNMTISTIEATKIETANETSVASTQPVEKDNKKTKGNKKGNSIDIFIVKCIDI